MLQLRVPLTSQLLCFGFSSCSFTWKAEARATCVAPCSGSEPWMEFLVSGCHQAKSWLVVGV